RPLADNGRRLAERMRPVLATIRFALILCSPMQRARETCELVGFGDKAVIDADLAEWNYGEDEGLTPKQIRGGRSGLRAGEAEAVRANRSSAGERSMGQPKGRVMNRDEYDAVLFDLDGVITNTAKLHATCWKQMLDEYLQKRAVERGESFRPFDLATDYRLYLDGKPRFDGV